MSLRALMKKPQDHKYFRRGQDVSVERHPISDDAIDLSKLMGGGPIVLLRLRDHATIFGQRYTWLHVP
eukprot:1799087-Amphidinium_carterae.1